MNARIGRLLAVLALTGTLVVSAAAPASAHAVLVQASPSPGQVLTSSPSSVVLRFTESVGVSLGSVRVFDRRGVRVDHGGVERSADTVRLPVPRLRDGSYVVTWRVTSADSHPVEGAYTFQVGAAANATSPEVTGLARRLLASQRGDVVVGAVMGVLRWAVYVALALLVGVVGVALVVAPSIRTSRRARRLAWGAWGALVVSTVLGLLAYGPYGAGLGLTRLLDRSLVGDTLSERFGLVAAIRLGLLGITVPLVRTVFPVRPPSSSRASSSRAPARHPGSAEGVEPSPPRWLLGSAATAGALLSATPGLAGHAVTGDWRLVALPADVLHVLAMALWLGGLVTVAVVLLPRRGADALREPLARWSRLAFPCIVALVVTGAFQAWRQVGTLDALADTDYGRILIVKIVIFAGVLVLARMSHDVVLRLLEPTEPSVSPRIPVVAGGSDDAGCSPDAPSPDEERELRRLRRSVWAEVVVAALVLGATALLVNAVPAKVAVSAPAGGAAGVTLRSGTAWVDVTFAPARAGANEVHVTALTPSGAPLNVVDMTVTIDLPSRRIAPITLPLRRLGPGHYLAAGFTVPFPGSWRVTAKPLVGDFEQPILAGRVEIG